jgi:Cu(I)/Ag(I) efflux system membrane fusion protein
MKLVKRPEQGNGAVIELSAERVQQMGIKTAPVEQRSVAPVLRAVGVISADESRVTRVHTRVAGYVEQLFVDRTFAGVREGQPLYSIYSPELIGAEREFLHARTWTSKAGPAVPPAPDMAEAGQKRLEVLGLGREDVDELIALGEPPRTFTVHAPSAGVVTQKDLVRGSYVEAGALMFELTDLREVWVIAEVPQRDLEHLRKGISAEVRIASEPTSRTGRIDFVYPMLDASRRTARVRITVPNPDLSLRPGVSAEVSIALDPITGLFAPRDAVLESGEESYVFVARESGQFVRTPVRAGSRADAWVNILEGLKEGERVVTSATFLLDSETRLQNVASESARATHADGQP